MIGKKLTSISIRKKVGLLLIWVFLPAFGIIVYSGLEHRSQQIEDEKNNAMLLVQSLAAQQEHVAFATRQMLNTLAFLPEVHRLDTNACDELFRELLRNHPYYSLIAAVTPDGKVFASSTPFDPGVNLADRKYIRDASRTLEFSAGEYQIGRVSKVQSINYGFPVFDSNKSLSAFIIAGFKLDEYVRFTGKVKLPEDFSFTIVDHAGVRLFRIPEHADAPPGKAISENDLRIISGDQGEGMVERVGGDGVNRVYAFKQLRLRDDTTPYMYMFVGMPKDQITQKANSKMLINLLFLGIAALMSFLLAGISGYLSFVKPVARLTSAAQRLGRGDLATRTSLPHTSDDLGELAKSFDDMASLLEQRSIEQGNADRAFRESEAKYRGLIETTDTGYVIVDTDGRALDANAEYVRLSGHHSIAEILGRSVLEWTASHDLVRNGEEIRKCVATGKVRHLEIDYVDREGRVTPVEICGTLTQTAEGQVIICLIKDISERKKMEAELLEAYEGLEVKIAERTAELAAMNEYLENIFESSPDVIAIVDEHGKFVKWNTMAAKLLEYSFEEIRGKSAFELYPDKNRLDEMLTDLRRDGSVKNFTIDMAKKHGGVATFEISVSLIKNRAGNTAGSISVARDLSEVKKANEELQKEVELRRSMEKSLWESEAASHANAEKYRNLYQEFQALLDAIPDILVLLTPDLKAIWANRAYAARAGKENDPVSLVGQLCHRELHHREEPCDGCPAPNAFNFGQPWTSVISTATGEIFEVRAVPIKDDNGTVIKLINLARDITETRKAEEELQSANSEMAQVFASIPSFLIGLTAEGKIMRWNNSAEKTFGIGNNSAMGKTLHQCGIEWDWVKVSDTISVCQTGAKQAKLHNCRFLRNDGKEGFLEITFSPLNGAVHESSRNPTSRL